jgi:hypothetical protein
MTLRTVHAFPLLVLAVLTGACSSDGAAPTPPPDAGPHDAGDAGHDSSSGFPVDEGGPPTDAPTTQCDQLRTQVIQLQTAARACNPQGANECSGAVDGICCSITVSFNNSSAVNDFTQAVTTYKTKCTPDCSKVICGQTPTLVCDPVGAKGTCE